MHTAQSHRTASLFHDDILREPALIAVKELLNLRTHLPTLASPGQRSLSQDASIILAKCRDLRSGKQRPPSYAEIEGYALNLYTLLLESYSKEIVQSLSYDTRFKLSLIVWHFHAPPCEPSKRFLLFLESPMDKTVWERLHARYQDHIRRQVPYEDFVQSFDFLLSSQLPFSQQTSKNLDNSKEFRSSRYPRQLSQALANRRIRSDPFLRQNQSTTSANQSSSTSHHPRPMMLYTGGYDSCGQTYPIRRRQSFDAPVGGQDGQDGRHFESLPQSQSTGLLPQLHVSIRSSRRNVASRSDQSPRTWQHRSVPYHTISHQGSGTRTILPNPALGLPHSSATPSDNPQKKGYRYD